jgi:uncharacterized repeat protein (TIGR01451 family)
MAATLTHRPSRKSPRTRRRAIQHYMKRRMFMEKLEDRRLLEAVPTWTGADEFQCGDPGCPLCCGTREAAEDWDTNDLRHRLGVEAPAYGPQLAPLEVASLGTSSQWTTAQDTPFFLRRELVIIDAAVSDYKQLLTDLAGANDRWAQIEALMIDSDVDGIAALTQILDGVRDVDAVHIVSHGSDGMVRLGNVRLTAENLDQYADQIAGWRSALKPSADILFYGCNLASSEAGRQFVDRLQDLVGVDIAASNDTTGDYQRGNDWDLEYQTGPIDTETPFSDLLRQNWDGSLEMRTFPANSYVIDMGQATQTIGNALKPYGLLYDLVTNQRIPVAWAIDSAKDDFRFATTGPVDLVDFAATADHDNNPATPSVSKDYIGGPFVINGDFVTPAVLTAINTWRAQGVVVDKITAPFTAEIYDDVTSFPRAVLDLQNGSIVTGYYANAGVPATSYVLGNPTNLNSCYDLYVNPHGDPQDWVPSWRAALVNFVDNQKGGLWAACHSVSAYEDNLIFDQNMKFLSTGLIPWGSHSAGTPAYEYNAAAANDPIMQILDRVDLATTNGSEQIYIPTAGMQWRPTTTVAVYDNNHPQNPVAAPAPPQQAAAVVAYGYAYGDPTNGFVMYEAGHAHNKATAADNIAAQRAYFNFLAFQGTLHAPDIDIALPSIVAGQNATLTATISGGSGSGTYQWVSANGSVFSQPTGTWTAGTPITTNFLLSVPRDTIKLLVTDSCGRRTVYASPVSDSPPTIDLDANNSSGATGYNYSGTWQAGGISTPAVDADVDIVDAGPVIVSATIRLTNRLDGTAETLLISQTLAGSLGITVTSDGNGGFNLAGTATQAQYEQLIATLQYTNTLLDPTRADRVINVTVNDGASNSNTAVSTLRLTQVPGDVEFTASNYSTLVNSYTEDSTIYLTVNDLSPAFSPTAVDTITVTVTNPDTGDVETVTLTETGANTGIFNGSIPSSKTGGTNNQDGTINALGGDNLVVTYVDPADPNDTDTDTVVIVGVQRKQLYLNAQTPDNEDTTGALDRNNPVVVPAPNGDQTTSKTSQLQSVTVINNSWSPVLTNRDSYIDSGGATDPNKNFGIDDEIKVKVKTGDNKRGLLYFPLNWADFNNEPVNSATLTLRVTGEKDDTVKVYRVTSDWTEGTENNTTNGTGVTWNDRNGSAAGDWITNGGDFNGTLIDSKLVNTNGANVTFNLTSLVQGWLDGTYSNYGIILVGTNDDSETKFSSREGANAPSLTITTLGGTPGIATFTQAPTMASPFTMPAGGEIKVRTYIEVTNGRFAIPANIDVALKRGTTLTLPGATPFFSVTTPPTIVSAAGNLFELEWTGTLANAVTVPSGEAIQLVVTSYESSYGFKVLYDSATYPSQVIMDAQTVIAVDSVGVYSAAYPGGGSPITNINPPSTVYVRPVVSDPFGAADITSVDVVIKDSGGNTVVSQTLTTAVASTAGTKTFEYAWNTALYPIGLYDIIVTAHEGTEGVTATRTTQFAVAADPDVKVTKTDGGISATVGNTVAYVLTYQNIGLAPAEGVVLTETVPAYARVDLAASTPGWTLSGSNYILNLGTLAPNSSGTATFAVIVDGNPATSPANEPLPALSVGGLDVTRLTNTASISAANEPPNGPNNPNIRDNNSSTDTTPLTAAPDLRVTKTETPAGSAFTFTTSPQTQSVTYRLTYQNVGTQDATGVVITETLPAGTTYAGTGWTAVPGQPNRYARNIGNLAAGASGTVDITVQMTSPVPSGVDFVTNTAQIADDGANGPDLTPADNTGTDTTPVNAAPDLVVTKDDGDMGTVPGGTVSYTITYSNVGTQDATQVSLTETLPANTTFDADNSTGDWDYVGGNQYLLVIGNVPAGTSGTALFAVTVNTPMPPGVTQITNTVVIADDGANGPDPTPGAPPTGNNTATDTTPISALAPPDAELRITKDDGRTEVQPGDTYAYTVTVYNEGPDNLTNVVVTDPAPVGLTINSWSRTADSTGATASGAGSINDTIATFNSDDNGGLPITYTVNVTVTSAAGSTVTNIATVSQADLIDPDLANNTAIDENVVIRPADLQLTKTLFSTVDSDASGSITPGDTVVFRIQVTNAGTFDATGVQVTDQLPSGFTYVSDDAAGSGGAYAPGTGLWTIGALANGATATVNITATVNATGDYTNYAQVSASDNRDPDSTPGNGPQTPDEDDDASLTVNVQPKSDLELTKDVVNIIHSNPSGIPSAGDQIVFNLSVFNRGPNVATGVQVTDLLPLGYTYVSSSGPGTYTSGSGLWEVGTVDVLQTVTLQVTATIVGNRTTAEYTNIAEITASGSFDPDSDPAQGIGVDDKGDGIADDDEASRRPLISDLSLAKTVALASGGDSDGNGVISHGDIVEFTLTVHNTGPDLASGIAVRDDLPQGYVYLSDDGGLATTVASNAVTWNAGSLAVGGSKVLRIQAVILGGFNAAAGDYTNYAQVIDADNLDPDSTPADNSLTDDDDATATPPISDLRLSKTLIITNDTNPPGVSANDIVQFTLVVTNDGPDAATGVVVSDPPPDYFTYNSATGPGSFNTTTGVWSVGTLAANTSATLVITAFVASDAPGLDEYANLAQVTASSNFDPDSTPNNLDAESAEDDEAQVTGIFEQALADLSLTKAVGLSPAAGSDVNGNGVIDIGDRVRFTLTLSNAGPNNATGVSIQDVLPAGYTWVSGGTHSGGTVTWTNQAVNAGSSITLTFDATVIGGQTVPDGYRNWAQITAVAVGIIDPDSTPNNGTPGTDSPEDDDTVVTPAIADLSLTKTASSLTPGLTDTVSFTITVSNAGPNTATGVQVEDLLPAGLSYGNSSASIGAYNSGTGVWTVGNLNSGASATLTLTATVTATGSIVNYAQVSASGVFDPDSTPDNGQQSPDEDDDASVTLTVPLAADLNVTKSVNNATPNYLDTVTFTVIVSNSGPDQATGVSLEDILPAGLSLQGSSATQGSYNGSIWTLGTLNNAQTATLTVTARVTGTGSLSNVAQVLTSDQDDPDSTPGNNVPSEDDQASAAVTVPPAADLSVNKFVNDSTPDLGDQVTFTIQVTNSGPNSATNVRVEDVLPAGLSFVSSFASQGTYSSSSGEWTVGTLTNGQTAQLSLSATVTRGGTLTNIAQVTRSDQYDPDSNPTLGPSVDDNGDGIQPDDDESSATLTVPVADLWVTKTVDDPTPSVGQQVIFTITVTNDGPDGATGVILGDVLDPGLNYDSSTVTQGAYNNATGLWFVGNLANTASATLTVTATVIAVGTVPNTAQVTASDQWDLDSTPNNNVPTEDDQASLTLTATAQPPVAVNDSDLANPPGPVTLSVTGNDSDPNNDLLVGTVDLNPGLAGQQTTLVVSGEGTWSVDGLGNVTFTPAGGFTGDPTPIPYTVSDATGLVSNQATITIDYVPVASNDTSSGNPPGTPVTVPVLTNDTTGDVVVPGTVQIVGTANPGDPLTLSGEGTWSVNTTTGEITFTPESGFTGDPTPIQYTVQDNEGNTSNPATVTVDYNQQPPVAVNDSDLTNPPGPVTLSVTGNDTDPNNDLLVGTVDLNPGLAGQQTTLVVSGEGTWSVDGLGNVTFTPTGGFTGDPTPIPYTVSDATGLVSNQATITIDYVPVASNDTSSGNPPGTPVTVPVLTNDTTGDAVVPGTVQIVGTANPGDPLTLSGEGTWSVNTTTGEITFTPESGFTGDPTPIQYTVQDNDGNTSNPATVTVDYNQQPPVAVNDSDLANPPGPVTLSVTGNDTDPNNDLLVGTVDLNPGLAGQQTTLVVSGEGTWSVDGLGNVTFTPTGGFTGDPTPIPYTVSDATGLVSNQATITIDYVPVASNDSSSGNTTGSPVTVPVLGNDTTGDTVVPATVDLNPGSPGQQTTLVVPGEGTWTANPTTGEITFTPESGFTGDPTPIQYTVQDNDGNTSNPATVTVDYNQQPPVAVNDSDLANPPGPATLSVTGNDTDPNNDLLVNTVDLNPGLAGQQTTLVVSGEGTWSVDGLGNVTFTPTGGFTGDPTPIPYTVSDATGLVSNQATITIDYLPVASNDSSSGNTTGSPVTVPVLGNDTTGDTVVPATVDLNPGSPGQQTTLVVPGEGTWTANPTTGEITFTPESGFTGDPTPIQYTVQDNDGNTSNPATVTVDYNQQPPVAVNDSDLANPPGPATLSVTGNDTDPNNDLLVNTVDLNPGLAGQQTTLVVSGEGTWSVDGLGNVTFTPTGGFTGDPTPIPYTVSDATGLVSNQATITIDYVPVASNDSSSGNTTGSPVTVPVLGNDTTGDTVVPATVDLNPGSPGQQTTLVVPGEGTWTANPTTGEITFTPESGFTGDPTPIQYTMQDNDGNTSNPATVTVDYNQQPPVAVNDSDLANPPGPATLSVTGNDTDPNNDLLVNTVDLNPGLAGQQTTLVVSGEGTWSVDGLGNVTFTPTGGFTGDPTPIPYTVSDATGLVSNQATITIDYVPVASNDSSSGNTTGSPVTVPVLGNDTTGDTVVPATVDLNPGSPGQQTTLVVPGEGTWTANPTTGEITFTPESGFTGDPTPIQYTVQDNDGNTSNPATVTVDYNQQPPVAVNDSDLANPPGPATLSVTGNDTDPNNDLLVNTVDLNPGLAGQQTTLVVSGEGTWSVDGLGNVTFTPTGGFTGDPTPIPYTVSDATGLVSNQATITIDYVPVASNDSSSGNTTGSPVTVPVLGNDTTGDTVVPATVDLNPGSPGQQTTLVVPGEGTWTANPTTGEITFTPESGFTGDPTPIQYTVQDNDGNTSNPATVTVDYNQQPPVAVNDSDLANPPGPATLSVTGNDTDPNNDLLVNTVDLNPGLAGQQTTLVVSGEGTWSVDGLGNVTFTPTGGFTGDPTPIPYTISDATGLVSNQATITIDYVPVASNDSSSGNTTGSPVTVPVLGNDTTGDTVVPATVDLNPGSPGQQTTLVVPGEGTWTANPTTGEITFTPESGFTGDPTPIQYTVQDNDGNTSNPATVTVDYNQQPPVAVNDSDLANPPGPATLSVTGNDSDPNNDLLVGTLDLNPGLAGQQTTLVVSGEGTWSVDGLGNVTFTPTGGFTGDPTPIPYTVSDATGLVSNQATITIDYVPVASNDSSSGNTTGSPVTVPVLGNDTTGDTVVPATVDLNPGSPGQQTTLVVPGEGTWTANPTTGEITFTPESGFTGDPTPIQYTVQDNDGNTSNPATVTVDYNQQPPVAVNDSDLANPPGPATLSVTGNDTDPNNDLLVNTVDLNPGLAGQQTTLVVSGEGTWSVDGLGNVTFTPTGGFTGDPTPIPYTVSDATGLVSNQATITIDYVPVASNDSSSGNTTGSPVTVPVLGNDTTGDTVVPATVDLNPGSPGQQTTLVVPGEGTWTANPTTGEITFTPESGFTGDPTPIQYTMQDNDGNTSNPATVTVDYNQQPPVAVNDSDLANPPGPATLSVTGNDTDPNNDLLVNTVDLNPGLAGQQTTLVVSGEGTWSVDGLGNVTFTPTGGFTGDPTPIPYTVSDATGLVSNQATITIDYVPVASNDSSSGNTTGSPVTVPVLGNDTTGDTVVPATVDLNPGSPGQQTTLVVPGEGTWTANPTTGEITFTPESGFTGDPTPIQYTVQDNDGNTSNPATVTVDYNQQPPVAVNDSDLANPPGPATLSVTGNDTDPNNDLLVNTVDLNPGLAGQQTTLVVSGEGTWSVDGLGNVTFTPTGGFTGDPTPIPYTVSDATGLVSNQATITIDYVPVASNDSSSGNTTGSPVTVPVLGNDTTGDTVVPATVDLNPGSPGQQTTLVVPGEGTWTANPTTGEITFTPESGFTGDPTPIQYTVQDNDGNTSNPATVTVGLQPAAAGGGQ